MVKKFIAHGDLNVYVEDKILLIRANYSPNDEMVDEFRVKLEEYIDILKEDSWGSLAYFEGESVFPLDSIEKIEANLNYMMSLGLIGIAVVVSNTAAPSFIKQFWQSIYERQKVPHQFFDNADDAKTWLLNLIASKHST